MSEKNKQKISREPKVKPEEKDKKSKNLFANLLVVIYIVLVILSGYWYMARPVRAEQFYNAVTWWNDLASELSIPVPEDEQWPLA